MASTVITKAPSDVIRPSNSNSRVEGTPLADISINGSVSPSAVNTIIATLSSSIDASEKIVYIAPATPFQTDVITATAQDQSAYVGAGIWDVEQLVSPDDARRAWADVVRARDILRSVFVSTSEGIFRVGLEAKGGEVGRAELQCVQWGDEDGLARMDGLLKELEDSIEVCCRSVCTFTPTGFSFRVNR